MDRYAEVLAHLHGARLHDARAETRHLQHLVVSNLLHLACTLDEARVGRVNAVHIREDLAAVRSESARKSHSRGI